jgi:glycosyltransferase involved in cell wall biosynthesis
VTVPFGVVVPAYRAARFLPRCLASIEAQTLAPAAVVVVDDGSDDETAEIAARCGATVIRQPNRGPASARNAGVAALATPWVAFLDADDVWKPHALARFADAARRAPDVHVAFADYTRGDRERSRFATDRTYRAISRRPICTGIARCDRHALIAALVRSPAFISSSSLAVRRDAFVACGGYDEGLRLAEHLDLLLRLFAHSTAVAIEEVVSIYHRHDANLTRDPLVAAEWELRVFQHVLRFPDRYPIEAATLLQTQLPTRLLRATLFAARAGRFAEARERLARSWSLLRSPSPAGTALPMSRRDARL